MNLRTPWERIAERLGAGVVDHWRLPGGVSADVHAVVLARPDGSRPTVVVRHLPDGAPDPDAIAREHALLLAVADHGIPVARPLLLDTSGTLLPGPFLVLPFVFGDPDPSDRDEGVRALARVLARLHGLDPASLALPPGLPERGDPRPELPAYLPADRAHLEDLADAVSWPEGPRCLLHGDVWPGNVLWSGSAPTALLDWEDAAVGDPLSDLACARAEITVAWGDASCRAFTDAYAGERGPVDPARLAVWDLYVSSAALVHMERWGLDPDVLAHRRVRTRAFLDGAVERLG